MYNPMDLTGRRILVTGASSGLGRATAVLMSRLGARLVLVSRNAARLQETLAALDGSEHQIESFDLNEVDKIPDFVADLAKLGSPFSGLVHAAGVTQTKPLQVASPDEFQHLYRLNVVAAAQLLRGLTRRGVISDSGCSVVIVGSITGLIGSPGLTAYASSKAAVMGLVRSASMELARYRIRVNAVVPGHFEGDSQMAARTRKILGPEHFDHLAKAHPLGIGTPEDVANAVIFLVADSARWITGSCLVVDGGCTVRGPG